MLKPYYLKEGATIGIVAPSSPCNIETTEKHCRLLSSCGYNVIPGESCFSHHGYLAGSDLIRADDINEMFRDSTIDAVFCLRGGYGCTRICELLNKKIISENPKIFLGFSDITALHIIFNTFCGLVTFHGPLLTTAQWGLNDFASDECMRILKGGACTLEGKSGYNLRKCEGIVCGGNLTLIESLIGTKYELDVNGKILILEDVGENNYAIDRKLTHLKQAGYFKKCKAVILGSFSGGNQNVLENNLPLRKITEEIIVPEGTPIIFGVPFGHISKNPTIPLGAYGKINGTVLRIEPGVSH